MAKRDEIVSFLSTELELEAFEDASLNGLQIEGNSDPRKIGTAVDAGLGVIEQAIELGCDFLLVHHGLFWGKPLALQGPHKRLVERSFEAGLSLYAAHLPLDANANWGNNFTLARMLKLEELIPSCKYHGTEIGCRGKNTKKQTLQAIISELKALEGASNDLLSLCFGPKVPEHIAIVSGGGADAVWGYQEDGFDTLITGEPKQFLYHYARDHKLNIVCAGHYATETVGVQEAGKAVAERFALEHIFIHHPTGI